MCYRRRLRRRSARRVSETVGGLLICKFVGMFTSGGFRRLLVTVLSEDLIGRLYWA